MHILILTGWSRKPSSLQQNSNVAVIIQKNLAAQIHEELK